MHPRLTTLVRLTAAIAGLWPASASAAKVPVTGLRTGFDAARGTYPPRLRIQDLQANGPQWDLYIQAMAAWQSMAEDDELSYYGLSGIHGRPFVAWNGVDAVPGAPSTGYCTHNEILFAIWHRPLVAVFEQVLAQHVQAAAARYTDAAVRATYRRAADTWRHPYWDWAVDKALPSAVVQRNVTFRAPPDGATTVTLANPLRRYRFRPFPLNATLFPPSGDAQDRLASFPDTRRCPDPFHNFTSNNDMASANVAAIDLAAQVYNVYARVADFGSMSSTACDSTSFEQQHNEVHVAVGGIHPLGHFADLAYSGFDPLFMMHHAAIDRHVALWQAIHANASMFGPAEDYQTPTGQFATAPGTNITADSPLKPFYAAANGTFHTGNSARDISVFGYTYPELLAAQAAVHARHGPALSRAVTAAINRLYGPSSQTTSPSRRAASLSLSLPPRHTAYFVRVGIEKAGLPLPAAVRVFVGHRLAGRLVLLASPPAGRVHGEISLARALDDGRPHQRSARDVLAQNFRWDVATLAGKTVQLSSAHDVSIAVREETVLLPRRMDAFPVYTNVRIVRGLGTE